MVVKLRKKPERKKPTFQVQRWRKTDRLNHLGDPISECYVVKGQVTIGWCEYCAPLDTLLVPNEKGGKDHRTDWIDISH